MNTSSCVTWGSRALNALFVALLITAMIVTFQKSGNATEDVLTAPYLSKSSERQYIGQGYYFADGTVWMPGMTRPHEVVFKLVSKEYELRAPNGYLVPWTIEVRRFIPNVPPQKLPLLREIWDSDRDGIADGYAQNMNWADPSTPPEFVIFTLPKKEEATMMDLNWFPEIIPTKSETAPERSS